jgi:hypothetical protein
MITFIKARERKELKYKTIDFEYRNCAGSGFTFSATEDGNPDFSKMTPQAALNYQYCIDNPELFYPPQVIIHTRVYTEPAIGRCLCGAEVILESQYLGARQCDKCGRWYNIFGQELKDPDYWED